MATRPPFSWLNLTRTGRLALIQGMKRSPWNLRRIAGVPALRNAKTLSLGLDSACRLMSLHGAPDDVSREARAMTESLLDTPTATASGHGWGYPFDWQSRVFYLRAGTPTVVCTGFVVRALDAALGAFADDPPFADRIRESMVRAARFVQRDLNRSEAPGGFCFSYSPFDQTKVVNATLLGAETLARTARATGDASYLDDAAPTLAWTHTKWKDEGGWDYGGAKAQKWEDSFHTGFNLLSYLFVRKAFAACGRDPELAAPIERVDAGYRHFRSVFFDDDGRPWYYRHTPWPIDTHAAAVAILTHLAFEERDPEARGWTDRTLGWTIDNLWLREKGWFAFQIKPRVRIEIPYIRWCQGWMLRALAEFSAVRAETVSAAVVRE